MRNSSSQAVPFYSEIVTLKAIEIAVAPVVITAVVAVEGKVKITGAGAEGEGDNSAPAAESAVIVVKGYLGKVG